MVVIFVVLTERVINELENECFFTLGWHLVVVVEFVYLNDPESCAGGDFGPWQV